MMRKSRLAVPLAFALTLVVVSAAQAQDDWKSGIGAGFTSFRLDGDIGFPTVSGGVIVDVDLDNSDTSDLVESGFGLGGYAAKGKWRILYQAGTATLEDSAPGLGAEWDRTMAELAGVYNFAKTGKHSWGVLFGARHIAHDWTFTFGVSPSVDGEPPPPVEIDESWTDALIGLTHAVPFGGGKWSWANRLHGGFGDSEGSFFFQSTIARRFGDHWSLGLDLKQHSIEFGDEDEIGNSDFYLYDVDEPGFGIGFLYHW